MKTGNVNLNKDGINPIMGNIKPSFLHIHSPERNKSNIFETTVTFCLATTTPIYIEFLKIVCQNTKKFLLRLSCMMNCYV